MKYLLFTLLLIGLLNSCSDENSNNITPMIDTTSTTQDSIITDDDDPKVNDSITSATYIITYQGVWSGSSHPIEYPNNSHFSGLVGMAHQEGVSLFKENKLASEGIKVMAETGGKEPLISEINTIIESGTASQLISEGGLSTGTSSLEFEVTVYSNNSHISLVSMIAPSPDWFIAIEGLNLFKNNEWIEDITVNPIHYDAGTDSGVTFKSRNVVSNPQQNIYTIKDAPLGDGQKVNTPLATLRFRKK